MASAFTNPFLSSLERRRRPKKHNRNLEPFFHPRDFTLQLLMRSFRYTWPGTVNWYNTTMFTLKWKLLTQNTVQMAIKKGVNHSNNKKRCSAGNLDDLLWKCRKSRYADFKLFGHSLKLLANVQSLRLGSEVCNWYRLAISPIWRRRSTNV